MSRTTIKQLEAAVDRLNEATGSPLKPYSRETIGGKDKLVAQIGNYHIDQCYGGYQLVRMVTNGGGVSTVQPCRGTKTDCWNTIQTVLNCLRD